MESRIYVMVITEVVSSVRLAIKTYNRRSSNSYNISFIFNKSHFLTLS